MNHIWTNLCRFLPYDLKEQINELDNDVAEYIAPLLLKESQFYFNYLRDSDRTNLPQLDRPIMINKDDHKNQTRIIRKLLNKQFNKVI